MFIGYLVGIFLGRSAKSISFPLFLLLVFLAFAFFKIIKGLYIINKWEVLAEAGYMSALASDIFIYLVAFSLGCFVAYLLSMRIRNSSLNKILKFILMVPVLNLSAFFLRLSKDTKPNFRITKYNATTLTVLVFGAFLAQSPIDKAAIVAEEKYRYVMNNNAAERIIEIYKENRGFPYNFDDGGYLKVYQLEADYGTVEFKMKETEQDIFDWESEELNTLHVLKFF